MVLELLLDAFGRGEVEEGQHWGKISIMATDNCKFDIAILSLNHLLHVFKSRLDDGGCENSSQMVGIKQHKKVALNVLQLFVIFFGEFLWNLPA